MLEARLQSPFTEGGTLLFEPDPGRPEGVEMPELLVKQQSDGRILLVMENHSALSSYLKAGQSVGTATPIAEVSVYNVTTTEQKGGTPPTAETGEVCPDTPPSPSGASDSSNTVGCRVSPPYPQLEGLDCHNTERLQQLFNILRLPESSLEDDQLHQLRQLITRNANVFALDDSELGYTDQVEHHVDTGDTQPLKQSVRRVPFVHRARISKMVEDMEKLGVVRRSASAWSSPVVFDP